MSRNRSLEQAVRTTLAASILVGAAPALAQELRDRSGSVLDAVVVTAQKREESIQDVPIAVSAFSAEDLAARGIDGGPGILQAIPNVSFSKGNFTSYNLQIRGIGSKLVAGSGDQGVGVHLNNAPLAASRFYEADFYDIERIEVLRGPQGTVYGRNATGGVFNAITAKPTDELEGSLFLDVGNYESRRVKAMVNVPITESFQFRLAGSLLERDGFNHDLVHDRAIDGRDIMSGRATLAFAPNESLSAYLMWEHFEEHDDRQRTGKQLCTRDPGPATVDGVSTTQSIVMPAPSQPMQARWFLSQGCQAGSIYSPSAFSTMNTNGSLGGMLANLVGIGTDDLNAGRVISTDLRTVEANSLPVYRANADVVLLNVEFNLSDELTLTSLTSHNDDELYSRQDFNNTVPIRSFNPIPGLAPGGIFQDPQLGATRTLLLSDISFAEGRTWTEELRLQSAFDGPLNFNVGAIYIDLDSPINGGYYVFFNTATIFAAATNPPPPVPANVPAIYIDPNYEPDGLGHNYYYNKQSYQLKSTAVFGELYWQMLDSFKWTVGLRYTDDRKEVTNYGIQMLAPTLGGVGGFPPGSISTQSADWKEVTGRVGFDYRLTDDSLLYLFYSKGYKGGGFNPASFGNVKPTFDPEFVNAIELGSKNTLVGGRVLVNGSLFYYDYAGYQVSKIADLTAVNENVDAEISGAELEVAWQVLDKTRIDANIGYLRTEIQEGSSVDVLNRTQGDPTLSVVKGSTVGSNCVVPTAGLATFLTLLNSGAPVVPDVDSNGAPIVRAPRPTDLLATCSGALAPFGMTPSDGVAVQLAGKELPNAPRWTFNIGAQQSFALSADWSGTLRFDYYKQTDSYARFYNSEYDRLKGWSNINASLGIENPVSGWSWLVYAKNIRNDDNITDTYLTDDSAGLFTNTFLNEPALYGVSVSKKF